MSATIDRYLQVQTAYAPTASADGRWLAFLTNVTGMPQVWQVPAGATRPLWPQQLTFDDDRVLGAWYVPGDPGWLVYGRDAGGDENAQLYRLDLAAAATTPLTAGYRDAMHSLIGWSRDGQAFYFAANRRQPHRFDLYRQRPEEPEAQLLWRNDRDGFLARTASTPGDRRLILTREVSSTRIDLLLLDVADGRTENLSPRPGVRYYQPAVSPDGRYLYLLTDLDADFLRLKRLHLDTGQWESVVAPDWDVEMFALDPTGRFLAYVVNEAGIGRLAGLDLVSGDRRPAPSPDEAPGVVGFWDEHLEFAPDGRHLYFSYTSARRSSDLYAWDLADDNLRRLTQVGHGGLDPERFVNPVLVEYPSFDERSIPAWYFPPPFRRRADDRDPAPPGQPASADPAPVVVMVHGGPASQARPSFNFLAQYFLQQGFAVLQPNVRGSSGYGQTYLHLDDVERRLDSVADLARAVSWLSQRSELDAGRVVVYGGSYGGFMVLAGMTAYPDLWAAGINLVGISNLATFLENTSAYRRPHREAEYGSLERDRDFLESIAPINHLDAMRAPLMVIHGANDPRVPLSEAEQLVQALNARQHPVEFLVFDDEGHGIHKLHNKRVAYPAIVAFLNQVLGGSPLEG